MRLSSVDHQRSQSASSNHETFLCLRKRGRVQPDNLQVHTQGTTRYKWNASQPKIQISNGDMKHYSPKDIKPSGLHVP